MPDPTPQTLTLAIGQAKTLTVTMDEPPSGGVGSWAVRFRLRRKGYAILIEKSIGDGITVLDAVNGIWTIDLVGDDTAALQEIEYTWSFWRTDITTETPIAFGKTTPYVTAETG
jgi:hypothetical protein